MKLKNLIFIFVVILVLAVNPIPNDALPFSVAIFMEAFVSIHMSIFVLWPLSNMLGDEDPKKWFKWAFIIRIVLLLIFDIMNTGTALLDFFAVFIGGFIVVPICSAITKKSPYEGKTDIINKVTKSSTTSAALAIKNSIILKCTKCNSEVKVEDKYCQNCGALLEGNNLRVEEDLNNKVLLPTAFDDMYFGGDDYCLVEFLKRELKSCGIDLNETLMPSEALKRKKVMNTIFMILVFVYISLIFFHFPILTYLIGLIILIIFYKIANNYTLIKFLSKKVKERPSEKISNIVMDAKMTMVKDDTKNFITIGSVIVILLAIVTFWNPHILYEKINDSYGVRFYTFGLTNFRTAEIPDEYNGKKVISLRGNTFSNMPLLKSVKLSDNIIEIRGQAFKNDFLLSEVNIPSNLEYLGGGAFYNCKMIKNIALPDTLKYMGGEVFYEASSLESIKLSDNLTEIRGNSFEECVSLKEITIPDKVTRIGGHAFYNNSSLERVNISEDSELVEIGSSAFRLCSKLKTITIPKETIVNERAFKESPTSVFKYGQIRYGFLVDKSKYNENSSYITLKKDISYKIGEYYTKSIAYKNNATLLLTNVDIISGVKYYRIKYTDSNGSINFDITKDRPSYKINDNVEIEVSYESAFNDYYYNTLTINVYYN